jgi:hypothetical protein
MASSALALEQAQGAAVLADGVALFRVPEHFVLRTS